MLFGVLHVLLVSGPRILGFPSRAEFLGLQDMDAQGTSICRLEELDVTRTLRTEEKCQ